ncbi:MAG: hypothetical protein JSS27_00945 [Planctomycetes bacterium]|nr:hypothetical protein [Planctomycetota bacterium]
MKRFAFALTALVVIGCGSGKKFDGRSKAAGEKSTQAMTADMAQPEREAFGKDVMIIATGGTPGGLMKIGKEPDAMFTPLDGMTLEQIRAKAAELRSRQAK